MNLDPLYDLIRRCEGLRLNPYYCPAGIPTIGYGHTGSDVKMDMKPITPEEAENFLIADASLAVRNAIKMSPILAHDDKRLCAIADFIFNLGSGRYRVSTLRRCVNEGDWEEAQNQIRRWIWGGGKKLPGLILRREAEAALLG